MLLPRNRYYALQLHVQMIYVGVIICVSDVDTAARGRLCMMSCY